MIPVWNFWHVKKLQAIKGVIRKRKLKDKHQNGQTKMKIIWKSNGSTKYYTKNEQHEPTKRRGWTKVILVEKLLLAPHVPLIDFTNILLYENSFGHQYE